MRICLIANPAAREVRRWVGRLPWETWSPQPAVWTTRKPGEARQWAAQAVAEGFDVLVAAGGDGTVNEVLNGIGDVPGGFDRVRLAVLPMGTANVWARELGVAGSVEQAWEGVVSGRERRLDLAWAECPAAGTAPRRYFVQLAGAGWDAQAIERVQAGLKRWLGPWAYVWAGWRALWAGSGRIWWETHHERVPADWVVVGNGRLYGGPFVFFPEARTDDGHLDVALIPRLTVTRALAGGLYVLWRRRLPGRLILRRRAPEFRLTGSADTPFEVDGEWAGRLPARFGVIRQGLRVAG